MEGLVALQVIILLLSLYFIVKVANTLPKPIAYTIYGFMLTSTVLILFTGYYYPETLNVWVNTLKGWQDVLKRS